MWTFDYGMKRIVSMETWKGSENLSIKFCICAGLATHHGSPNDRMIWKAKCLLIFFFLRLVENNAMLTKTKGNLSCCPRRRFHEYDAWECAYLFSTCLIAKVLWSLVACTFSLWKKTFNEHIFHANCGHKNSHMIRYPIHPKQSTFINGVCYCVTFPWTLASHPNKFKSLLVQDK